MGYAAKNNAYSTLAGGITNVAVALTVQAGKGALFDVTAPVYTYATLEDSGGNIEVVKVTARATDTLTIVRAQDGTAARAWNSGDIIECRPCAAAMNDYAAGPQIDGATAKTTPVDADTMGLIDSAASNVLKKVTWANIKVTLKAYFDTLYTAISTCLPLAGGNLTGGINSARGNITQHATTMNFFAVTSPDILDGTGSAVTITACVNAPQAGATRKFYPIVATVLTHGATFDIAGNANLTAAAGDCWIIEAKTASTYRVTAVKEDGTAVVASKQIQPISASVATNALTISASALTLDFRDATGGLTDSGTVTTVTGTPANLVISSGSTLGTFSGIQSRIAVLAMNNAGTIELAAVNALGGKDITETGLISTTAEGGAGAATSATVFYSTTARSNLAYRVIGYIESTQATAGTWATAPSTIQGAGGQAIVPRGLIMTGGAAIPTSSGLSISVTGFPVGVKRISINFNGTKTNGSSIIMVQIGDADGIENSGYTAGAQNNGGSYQAQTTGFGITSSTSSTDTLWGTVVLSLVDPSANTWTEVGVLSKGSTAAITVISAGVKSLTKTLDRILLTMVSGGDTFNAGSMSVFYEM